LKWSVALLECGADDGVVSTSSFYFQQQRREKFSSVCTHEIKKICRMYHQVESASGKGCEVSAGGGVWREKFVVWR